MTVEQIELRKILTQMLADNGINRETILDFTRSILDEKIDKAIQTAFHDTNIDNKVQHAIDSELKSAVRDKTRDMVSRAFSNIYVTVNCSSDREATK